MQPDPSARRTLYVLTAALAIVVAMIPAACAALRALDDTLARSINPDAAPSVDRPLTPAGLAANALSGPPNAEPDAPAPWAEAAAAALGVAGFGGTAAYVRRLGRKTNGTLDCINAKLATLSDRLTRIETVKPSTN